jgi:hypothetical protein
MPRERHSDHFLNLLNKQILLENKINTECAKAENYGSTLPTKSLEAFEAFIFGHNMDKFTDLPSYELDLFERKFGWVRRTHLAYKRVTEALAKAK